MAKNEEIKKDLDLKKEDIKIEDTTKSKKDFSPTNLEEIKLLLEKNLKWSQIIYEQNRKINRKLMWQTLSGWFRVLIIIVPLIVAIWFLPSVIQQFMNKYGDIFGLSRPAASAPSTLTVEQLLKMVPLDPAKQEQLKTLLK